LFSNAKSAGHSYHNSLGKPYSKQIKHDDVLDGIDKRSLSNEVKARQQKYAEIKE